MRQLIFVAIFVRLVMVDVYVRANDEPLPFLPEIRKTQYLGRIRRDLLQFEVFPKGVYILHECIFNLYSLVKTFHTPSDLQFNTSGQ